MEGKFTSLLVNTCRKLKGKINSEDLHTFLASCLPEEYIPEIPESPSVNEAFNTINRHKLWDYLNFHLFKQFVKLFADYDQEIKSWFKSYKHDLKSYKASKKLPFDVIAAIDSDSSDESISGEEQHEQCEWLEEHEQCQQQEQCGQTARYDQRYFQKLLIKVNKEFTLKDIEKLWKEFAHSCDLPSHEALLECSVGCISIVWLIPSRLTPQILSVAPHRVDFYHKHEIMMVELDGKCIYHEEEKHHEVHYCVGRVYRKSVGCSP